MTDTRIARRYAGAIFKLGESEGGDAISSRGQTLVTIDSLLEANPALDRVFKSPVISVAEKKGVIASLLDKVGSDALTRNFCNLLVEKERLPFFRDIVQAYVELLDDAKGLIRGTLTTAIELSAKKRQEVKASLEEKAGTTIELSFAVDPSILGGVVLQVGDKVLDASLRAQLEILRETFKRGN